MKWLALAVGSLAGGFARYLLGGMVYGVTGPSLPYGTLVVNLSGCFLIGLLNALAEERLSLGPDGRMLLMVGFCGAFTTFSTFMLETVHLWKDGRGWEAGVYVAASVAFGFLLFFAGEKAAALV
jgi:CrcB protein